MAIQGGVPEWSMDIVFQCGDQRMTDKVPAAYSEGECKDVLRERRMRKARTGDYKLISAIAYGPNNQKVVLYSGSSAEADDHPPAA